MTGEMAWIHKDGTDSNGDQWTLHAAIARALKAELRPFDKYQGPYILVNNRIRIWVSSDDGWIVKLWREDNEKESAEFFYNQTRKVCKEARKLINDA